MSYREKTPQIISILTRKLKPGKTFEDFQQAHLPPGEVTKTEFGYDVDYFSIPSRVINMISITDPSIILSIGFSYGTPEQILAAVEEKLTTEPGRAKRIAEVADKLPSQFFVVASDNNYGCKHLDCKQEELVKITPEFIKQFAELLSIPPSPDK